MIRRGVLAIILGIMIYFCIFFGIGDLAVKAGDFHNQYQKRNCNFLLKDYTPTEILNLAGNQYLEMNET